MCVKKNSYTFANQTVGLSIGIKMKDTKEYILETAFKLFLSKTYKEVTMKEIVNATGLSKGAFYHYFESKEQLFLDVINDYLIANLRVDYSQFDSSSLQAFYFDHLNFIDKRISGESIQAFYGKDFTKSDFYSLIFEANKLLPELKATFIEFDVYKLTTWTNVIQQAKQSGEIKSSMSAENIAKIFLSIIESTGIREAWGLNSTGRKERLSALWDGFYNQLKS